MRDPGIPDWFGMGGTLKPTPFQPCHGQGRFHCPRLIQEQLQRQELKDVGNPILQHLDHLEIPKNSSVQPRGAGRGSRRFSGIKAAKGMNHWDGF